jgi:hypothetical protein
MTTLHITSKHAAISLQASKLRGSWERVSCLRKLMRSQLQHQPQAVLRWRWCPHISERGPYREILETTIGLAVTRRHYFRFKIQICSSPGFSTRFASLNCFKSCRWRGTCEWGGRGPGEACIKRRRRAGTLRSAGQPPTRAAVSWRDSCGVVGQPQTWHCQPWRLPSAGCRMAPFRWTGTHVCRLHALPSGYLKPGRLKGV